MKLRICLGVSGSIAAYRSPDLVKELVARGHEVRVVLTSGGREFVPVRALETFSGAPVLATDPFDPSHLGTDHISLARWAQVFLVYGATANFLARYAAGLADDFLCLQLVATTAPVVLAPAMNPAMWGHPSVRQNVSTLEKRGVRFAGPSHGQVACGETGVGHISELTEIVAAVETAATEGMPSPSPRPLSGKIVLISAGPMRSSLDPVRFIQNRSSGLMGLELSRAALDLGATVKALVGPVEASMAAAYRELPLELQRYETPEEYGTALDACLEEADAFLSAAAVLDFETVPVPSKIDRAELSGGALSLRYRQVPDFVAHAGANRRKPGQKVIAFAAETGSDAEILKRADGKLRKKKADALIANPVRPGLGPEAADNEVWVLRPGREPLHLGPAPKRALAHPILEAVLLQ